MRILWIKTELLHPIDKGGRIRSYQILRALSRQHHVTYLCLDDGLAATDAAERAREYAHEVVLVPFRPPAKMTLGYFADLLVCDFLMPSVDVPAGLPAPAVLFQHNVEAMIWQRHATVPQHPLRRTYMRLQWRRMLRYEAQQCRRFAHVIAVSSMDAELMRREYDAASVGYVPTGVDL